MRTPSISFRSLQAETETRVSSVTEVPGWVSQCIKKSRSLKFGSNWLPKVGTAATRQEEHRVIAIAGSGRRISGGSATTYSALEPAHQWRFLAGQLAAG